jgi:FkbM family methyltransferase
MNKIHKLLFVASRRGLRGSELLWRTLGRLAPYPGEGKRVRLPNGFSMRFNRTDWTSFSIYKGQYERATYKFLKYFARSSPGAKLDIGGNLGSAAFEILKGVNNRPNQKVHIFEPFPNLMSEMKSNLQDFKEQIEVHQVGLCEIESSLRYFKPPDLQRHSGLGLFVEQTNNVDSSLDLLEVTTLDKIVKDYKIREIGLIKIDAEGYEMKILLGARETIKHCSPSVIVLEFTPWHYDDVSLNQLCSILHGYECLQIEEKGKFIRKAILRPISMQELGDLTQQVNLVFKRTKSNDV